MVNNVKSNEVYTHLPTLVTHEMRSHQSHQSSLLFYLTLLVPQLICLFLCLFFHLCLHLWNNQSSFSTGKTRSETLQA